MFDEGEDITALEYLQSIYRNPSESDGRRLRAAIEALPYETPKLSSVAMGHFTGQDFAALLDRAVERSTKVIEGKVIQIEGRGQVGIEEER